MLVKKLSWLKMKKYLCLDGILLVVTPHLSQIFRALVIAFVWESVTTQMAKIDNVAGLYYLMTEDVSVDTCDLFVGRMMKEPPPNRYESVLSTSCCNPKNV